MSAADPTAAAGSGASPGAGSIRRKRPATIVFAEAMLMLEAFLLVFAALVGYGLRVAPAGAVWGAGLGAAAVLGVLSGVQRTRTGRVAGSVAQLVVLAGGFWVPMMFVVGGIFVVLWVAMLRLGARIDRERAAFDAAHPGVVEPPRPPRAH